MKHSLFSLPYVRRKLLCCSLGLLAGAAMAVTMPVDVVTEMPLVQAGAVINGLLMGLMVSVVGFISVHPLFKIKIPVFLRGAVVAAFVHLDFVVYIWDDQPAFWSTIAMAAVFGGVVDLIASSVAGNGKVLNEGMQ